MSAIRKPHPECESWRCKNSAVSLFYALMEGHEEVALSYWPDEQHVQAWRAHPEHRKAQKLGQSEWYESYSVEVARIERSYQVPPNPSFQRIASGSC